MSLPQHQIGFNQSKKLYLNLWLWRWLKPNVSLVIPIGLWHLRALFGDGCMNCKMLFLKTAKFSELCNIVLNIIPFNCSGREERVLQNKYVWHCIKKYCWLLILFLVLYTVLVVWILSNRYLDDWFLVIFKK